MRNEAPENNHRGGRRISRAAQTRRQIRCWVTFCCFPLRGYLFTFNCVLEDCLSFMLRSENVLNKDTFPCCPASTSAYPKDVNAFINSLRDKEQYNRNDSVAAMQISKWQSVVEMRKTFRCSVNELLKISACNLLPQLQYKTWQVDSCKHVLQGSVALVDKRGGKLYVNQSSLVLRWILSIGLDQDSPPCF